MRHFLSFCASLFLVMVIFSCSSPESEVQTPLLADSLYQLQEPNLVPAPVSLQRGEGQFVLSSQVLISNEGAPDDIAAYFNQLVSDGLAPREGDATDGSQGSIKLRVLEKEWQNNEAYRVIINPNEISLEAGTRGGLSRAIQCFRQLLPNAFHSGQRSYEWHLPSVTITDAPRFSWRGMLLDCCRHFMEKDFVKRYIDLLAFHRMNTLHWHLTEDQGWRIEIEKYPLLTEVGAWREDTEAEQHVPAHHQNGQYGGFYSKEEVREIVAYAAERGINVVPEIELPGHSQAAVAAYPHLSCTGGPHEVQTEWGVFKEVYCAGNDSTFTFLQDVLTEVMELFPSKYIHIGGDEAPKFRWEHCDKCQRRMAANGLHDEHELQSWFIQQIDSFLSAHDRKLVGWDEILEGGLAQGATVQSWRGFEGATEAARLGNDVIVSPTSHAYFDYDLRSTDMEEVYGFEPIPEALEEQFHQYVLGGECNMWTERAPQPTIDGKVFPRILAMAEVLWSPRENRDFTEFQQRVSGHYNTLEAYDVDFGFETEPVAFSLSHKTWDEGTNLVVNWSTSVPDLKLFVTSDTSTPEADWMPVMDNDIVIGPDQKDVYQRVRAEWRGEVHPLRTDQFLRQHRAVKKPITLETPYSNWYTAGGDSALVDGVAGSKDFRDKRWQGYTGEDMVAIIDLGEMTTINQFRLQAYQYNNAWIFLPSEIYIETSTDGRFYKESGRIGHDVDPKQKGQFIHEFQKNWTDLPCRYVKITARNFGQCPEWHDAAGSDAWLFVDELVIR